MQNILIQKREGLSAVVASIAVMLVSTVLAVTLGYTLTRALEISLSPAATCTQLQIETPFTIEKTDYNSELSTLAVTIKRSFNADTTQDLIFRVLDSDARVLEWNCGNAQCGGCLLPSPGESKTFTLEGVSNPSQVTLQINSCTIASKSLIQ